MRNILTMGMVCCLMLAHAAEKDPYRVNLNKVWAMQPLVAEAAPSVDPNDWGQWKFWNGQWWAVHFLQPESQGPSWESPKNGLKTSWDKYRFIWMKQDFPLPENWAGRRIIFSLNGIKNCDVDLYVNGTKAGTINAPEGEVVLTDGIKLGAVNEFRLGIRPGKGRDYKFERDPPLLRALAPVSIDDVFANTSWREKKLTLETTVTVPNEVKGEISAQVVDQEGKVVRRLNGRHVFAKGTATVKDEIDWKDPITWELGRGYLYTLKLTAKIGGKEYVYPDTLFGFREIWRDGRKIFMNGHEQKFRVTYNFGCNRYGAKFLAGVGYNCIQFAHVTQLDPVPEPADMEYYSRQGISVILPMCAFDWNTKNPLLNPGSAREKFKLLQAKNLRKFRNWPCVAMLYMGVNTYLPQWAYEAVHLGSGDGGAFAKMMEDLVASAKQTNPNVLYFSHSDGNTGEIASANLYFNWVPLQEREEWPSRWAERGHFPFQACEFGHPYQYSWYKEDVDLVTEYLAIYYGEEAYLQEPKEIQERHLQGLYIRRIMHPLFWRHTEDFTWRVSRAWRTFGVNAGIVWFNLDYGYGMPNWTVKGIYNKYSPNYNFFKSDAEVPTGRPEWAFPSWDSYRRGNLDFLGWIGGYPRITDRRHAYYPGEQVIKRNILLWDRFDSREFSSTWQAELGGKVIASGKCVRKLVSNRPAQEKITFTAPEVEKRSVGRIVAKYFDNRGKEIASDECAFEVFPKPTLKWEKAPAFALYDLDGRTAAELKAAGIKNFELVDNLAEAASKAKYLVIAPFALPKDMKFGQLPLAAVEQGLKVLVLPQEASVWQSLGFQVQDRCSRILYPRDRESAAMRTLNNDCLREWSGEPWTKQSQVYGQQHFGSLSHHGKHEPRWTYNMTVAALQLKTPESIGWLPQVDGELDLNYSALLKYRRGKGSIQFCTLDFFGRVLTDGKEGETPKPAMDAAIETTRNAVFADFLLLPAAECTRGIVAQGARAERMVKTLGGAVASKATAGMNEILLVGADANLSAAEVKSAADRGAKVLVVANESVARGLGLTLEPCPNDGIYLVRFDRKNPLLAFAGQNLFRWRERMKYTKIVKAPKGWTIDADGMIASRNGLVVSMYDPFYMDERAATFTEYLVNGQRFPVEAKNRQRDIKRMELSCERSHQFTARLLTLLGACPAEDCRYHAAKSKYDPYQYTYW